MNRSKQYYLILCLSVFTSSLSFAATQQEAREFIRTKRIGDAVALYAQLVATSLDNAEIQMEYAYALALSGLPENALIYLDKASHQGADKKILSFYAAQVFSLMGHFDIAAGFWKPTDNTPPQWLAADYISLLRDYTVSQTISREIPDSIFVCANALAAKGQYFQSLVLFRELEQLFPDSYLPYAGSSLVWEKAGKREIAAQKLDTAIVLMNKMLQEDSLSHEDVASLTNALPVFNEHLRKLQSGSLLSASPKESLISPQYTAYANGMLSSVIKSLNLGGGWFLSETANLSGYIGYSGSNGSTFFMIGSSYYRRKDSLVSGYGLNMQFGGGSTACNYSGSIGYSIFNHAKSRSTDIFLIYGFPVAPWDLNRFMIGISIGQSLYFGKRK
ncbi:MAG: tetratricopeptide repeat protein [Bacteroidales bacterium]|jgi:tetratricopeptide (TPR) repeat protein|nr:tetratricopeptide repeat protein [Bacteroidales bacterium]